MKNTQQTFLKKDSKNLNGQFKPHNCTNERTAKEMDVIVQGKVILDLDKRENRTRWCY